MISSQRIESKLKGRGTSLCQRDPILNVKGELGGLGGVKVIWKSVRLRDFPSYVLEQFRF